MDKPDINIGFVIYTPGKAPGTLDAIWGHQLKGSGTGTATGGTGRDYPGHYRIRYLYDDGSLFAEVDLDIERRGDHYDLSWSRDGILRSRGVGHLTAAGLVAGWRYVADGT
jgi:hypothetical protein